MTSIEITGLTDERVLKTPGTIDGNSVTLSNLRGCEIYLLDYSGDVNISNVEDCTIFIGPVDGAALFEGVSGSTIAVSAQQIQAKGCTNSTFYLQVVTVPTLSGCEGLQIGCWQGAYPGLASHFKAANLDPNINRWQQVKDINDAFMPSFTLIYESNPWEVPLDGEGPPENPVPFSQNGNGSAALGSGLPSSTENGLFGLDQPAQQPVIGNGHLDAADFSEQPGEHPKMREINDRLRERQESQQAHEQTVKTELVQKAAAHLEKFYAERQKRIENRAKNNREAEETLPVGGVEGNTEWEKAVNLVDFGFSRPNGTDLSRFKNVLFTAKSKNVQGTKLGV